MKNRILACIVVAWAVAHTPVEAASITSGAAAFQTKTFTGSDLTPVFVRRGGAVVRRGGAVVGPRGGVAVRRSTAVVRPGWRGGGVHRAAVVRPGWHGGGVRWARPAGYRWRPGTAIAAGAAVGFVSAAVAVAWAGAAPGPNMCWYYTDASKTQGFWDACP
jgi:hypothetical protein